VLVIAARLGLGPDVKARMGRVSRPFVLSVPVRQDDQSNTAYLGLWGKCILSSWQVQIESSGRGMAVLGGDGTRRCTVKEARDWFKLAAHSKAAEQCSFPLAVIEWDTTRGLLRVFRDPTGMQPLFFAIAKELTIVSDSPDVIVEFLGADASPDRTAIFQLLCRDPAAHGRMISQLRAIPPGCVTTFSKTRVSHLDYWQPIQIRQPKGPYECADELWSRLKQSILETAKGHDRVATELSGGLDSGGVSLALDDILAEGSLTCAAFAVSARFPGLACDEQTRIQEISDHLLSIEKSSWDGASLDPLDFMKPRKAWPQSTGLEILGTGERALVASLGADLLFSGYGGDQIFDDRNLASDFFAAGDFQSAANHVSGNLHRVGRLFGGELRKFVPIRPSIRRPLGLPPWCNASASDHDELLHHLAPRRHRHSEVVPTKTGRNSFNWIRSDSMSAQMDRIRLGWRDIGVKYMPALLNPAFVSWLVMLAPASRAASPHWRSLWRLAVSRRAPSKWVYGRTKMDFSPILTKHVGVAEHIIRETFTDRSLVSTDYFDAPILLKCLKQFVARPSLEMGFWLRSSFAIELWLRKLT
jgi:hypothetical protein